MHLLALSAALSAALRAENENLKAVVETLRRALYGARSERQLDLADQLPLALNNLSATPVEPAKLPRPANSNHPTRPQRLRNICGLPAHLPRVHVTIEPARLACPCCEGKRHRIGEGVNEMLDVVPAKDIFPCVEVLTGPGRLRRWSDEEKMQIVAEAMEPGAVMSQIARPWRICPGQMLTWRRLALGAKPSSLLANSPGFALIVEAANTPALPAPKLEPARVAEIEIDTGGAKISPTGHL